MNVLITFTTIGADAGPFNLYSNVDGFSVGFVGGITRQQLLDGYPSTAVPIGTTIIRACSIGVCTNCYDMNVPAGPLIYYEYTQNVSNCTSCATLFIIGNLISNIALVPGKWYYDSVSDSRVNPLLLVGMHAGPVNSNINLASQQDICADVICP